MKAVKGEEILLTTANKLGKLEEICRLLKEKNVNLRSICAYAEKNKAWFMLITSDNVKAKDILKDVGKIESRNVVIVDMPDEVGQLHALTAKLKAVGVDINYIYGTTSKPQESAITIFSSSDNDKALEAIAQ